MNSYIFTVYNILFIFLYVARCNVFGLIFVADAQVFEGRSWLKFIVEDDASKFRVLIVVLKLF
jgi:hypothetical protein